MNDRIIRIIRKLQEMKVERGCNPAEAAGAAVKIQQLLREHQLSLVDIQAAEPKLREEMGEETVKTGRKVRNPGEACLAMAVAAGCDCRMITSHYPRYSFNFLGYVSDIQVASHLFQYLRDGLTAAADREARGRGVAAAQLVRFRNNFLMGAAGEIRTRLKAEKEAAETRPEPTAAATEVEAPAVETPAPKRFSLVAIKEPEVNQFFKQMYPKTRKGSGIRVRANYSAVEAGRRAGRTIPLRKAVGNEQPLALSCH